MAAVLTFANGRHAARRAGLETAFALAVLALTLSLSGTLARIDNALYDAALRLWPRAPAADVVIVAIDDASLAELGRWPWSWRVHAQLIGRLQANHARAVALDVIFAEPELDDVQAGAQLAAAIAAYGRVVLPVYPVSDAASGQLREGQPLPPLAQAAAALGHVDAELDDDGVTRRIFLHAGVDSPRWPTLALALAREGMGTDGIARPAGSVARGASGRWVRSDEMLIPFAGSAGHVPQVSYAAVLRDPAVAATLRDRYVLVGATATGLRRDYATPVTLGGQPMSGVELHANVFDGVRNDRLLRPLPPVAQAVLVVVLAVACLAVGAGSRPRSALLAGGALVFGILALSLLLLGELQRWFAPSASLVAVMLAYPLLTWRRLEQAARSLAAEQGKSRATLHAIADAVIATDRQGRVDFANPFAERLSGRPLAQMRGRPVGEVLDFAGDGDRAEFQGLLQRCLESGQPAAPTEYFALRDADQRRYDVRVTANPVQQPGGATGGVVLAISDLTEAVAMTRSIEHQATHDALTSLPNRTLLRDRLQRALIAARRSGTLVAVLFVDVDQFKRVNDGFGHAAGDALLQEVAQRLLASARGGDTVARWGGDEFVLVAEDLPSADIASTVAWRTLESLRRPIRTAGAEHFVTASIGVSLFPRDGQDSETLVQDADRAMYRAKQQGGNQLYFFSESMNQRAVERREIEAGLRRALSHREFELYLQPQIAIDRRRAIGAEALLRWRHPEAGLLLPHRFIGVAEECGLIHDIGDWVLREACTLSGRWQAAGLPPLPIAVNVSPRQLIGEDIVARVRAALGDTGADPALLKLEVTESAVMHDIDHTAELLRQIRALKVGVAIDDFGTGYSSLTHLKRLPADEVKIDGSFVRNLGADRDDAAIVRGVIDMAHGMQRQVVAEWVETETQVQFLCGHGCDALQGHFFWPALPVPVFLTALRALEAGAPPGPLERTDGRG